MISVKEAYDVVLSHAISFGHESVRLEDAVGRTLGEDIEADRDFPPFDRVAMDGIAIRYEDFQEGCRKFEIKGIGAAGSPRQKLSSSHSCIEIMTGAPLPLGTDTVVRYEDLRKEQDAFNLEVDGIRKGQNIHTQGKDGRKGDLILNSGIAIRPIEVNILATVGKSNIEVYRLPKVAVISSGDELVEVDVQPETHQIRRSNVYMLHSRLEQLGIKSDRYHIDDEKEAIESQLSEIIEEYDVLLLSGGVSKGKFDYIPEALENIGVSKHFHRVAQRPGKPFWFGTKGNKSIFAFPGNPMSTLTCFQKYFCAWWNKCLGRAHQDFLVKLEEDVVFKPQLTYFAQAKIKQQSDGMFSASVFTGNGSGDIVSPSRMDGFVELPANDEIISKGSLVPFISF